MSGPTSRRGYIDRDEVLEQVDLEELADALVGSRKMIGSSPKWPSPVQGHEQTGRTPPMSIFTDRSGCQRWTCFATGHRGTAFDLVMETRGCDFKEAVAYLAGMAGVEAGPVPDHGRRPAKARKVVPAMTEQQVREGLAAVRDWHAQCEQWLETHSGRLGRQWLDARGYGADDIAAARVGFDPGPHRVPRPRGLPRLRPALVLPVMTAQGEVVFAQSRALNPASLGKYFNPVARLEGKAEVAVPNPGIGWLQPAEPPGRDDPVVLCEGITDAIAARPAGFECGCVIGTGNAVRDEVVGAVIAHAEGRPVVLCFDGDDAGVKVAAKVVGQLRAAGCAAGAVAFEGMDLTDALCELGGIRFCEMLQQKVLEQGEAALAAPMPEPAASQPQESETAETGHGIEMAMLEPF